MPEVLPWSAELSAAHAAVRAAGAVLLRRAADRSDLQVEVKSMNDYVTDVDREAERAVVAALRDHFPGDAVLAEESGRAGAGSRVWVVDPLDGTANFVHGVPAFGVSVALEVDGELVAGAVLDPSRDELFDATAGGGARLDGEPISVSTTPSLSRALVGTGFPFRRHDLLDRYLRSFEAVQRAAADQRRPGAAALDLCSVASGRFDGFWELALNRWDVAAGALIVVEAGGVVSGFPGQEDFRETGNIVAGNRAVHAELMAILGGGDGERR